MIKDENEYTELPGFIRNLIKANKELEEEVTAFKSKGFITIKSRDAKQNKDVANIMWLQRKKIVRDRSRDIRIDVNNLAAKIRGWLGYYERY